MLKIHSVETMSTKDGPGLRTVFFLQGCNFRCQYCHNPDTQVVNKKSQLMTTEQIMQILRKNMVYFGKDGGVTFSGGEALLQAENLLQVVREIKKELNLSVTIDTNGSIIMPAAQAVIAEADLVIFDLKQIDEKKHLILTGCTNQATLETIEMREKIGRPMWIRYVLVPGITDDKQDLEQWGKWVKKLKWVKKVEILPYHTLGKYKYEQLSRKYPLEGVRAANENDLKRAWQLTKIEKMV